MQTNSSVTIYNKYFDPVTRMDAYRRTVLHDVFWTDIEASVRAQAGRNSDDTVYMAIPFSSVPAGLSYVRPRLYAGLDDRTGYFTLADGDRIVKDEVTLEIQGSGISALDKAYEAFTVTSVSTRNFGSPHMHHWGVTAK